MGMVYRIFTDNMIKTICVAVVLTLMLIVQCNSYEYVPPPKTFEESDLVGIWQAKYGGGGRIDTIELKDDGTYQQRFEFHQLDYQYESSWNK